MWRAELLSLLSSEGPTVSEGESSGSEQIIDSIFPSLDVIHSMSSRLQQMLAACNSSRHALMQPSSADHASFTHLLVARVRDALRRQRSNLANIPTNGITAIGHSASDPLEVAATVVDRPHGSTPLASTLSCELVVELLDPSWEMDPTEVELGLREELAAALLLPLSQVSVTKVTPSHTSSGNRAVAVGFTLRADASTIDAARAGLTSADTIRNRATLSHPSTEAAQQLIAFHRKVEALATALALPAASANNEAVAHAISCVGGASRLSERLAHGRVTCAIDRALGLRRIDASGQRGRVIAPSASTLVREITLDQATWDRLIDELSAAGQLSTARQTLIAPDATLAALAGALRGPAAQSVGDTFTSYARHFEVFSAYTSGLEAARSRVNAIKKLESGSQTLARCQLNPRTKGADIHNWLARPNQHLMRQPMLLEQLLSLTPDEHPEHGTLVSALAEVKEVVATVDRRKFEQEQRVKLEATFERVRGDIDDEVLLPPHRHLLREGAMIEVKRRSPRASTTDSDLGSDTEDMTSDRHGSFAQTLLGGKRATKYAILCNDSLWYCELLRGNRYRLLHTFHFTCQSAGEHAHERHPAAVVVAATSRHHAFWVSDEELSVLIQPPKGSKDAAGWVQEVMTALARYAEEHGG